MNSHTRMSAKGQLVLPKAVRDRLAWPAGTELEVIEHAGGVTLRAAPAAGKQDAGAVFARLRQINTYRGPPLTDADIDHALLEMAVRSDPRG